MVLPSIKKSKIAQIPSVPILKSLSNEDARELQRWMLAVTEHLQVRDPSNGRGGLRDKYMSIQDMVNLGFDINTFGMNNIPYGFENSRLPIERWDDLRFPASVASRPSSNPANDFELTIDSVNFQVLQFEDEGVNVDRCFFIAQLPHSWKYGSIIKPHIHWVSEDTTSGNVAWKLFWTKASIGTPFTTSSSSTIFAAKNTSNTYHHLISGFDDIDMSGHGLSTIILFQLQRLSTDAGDTLTNKDAYLLEFDIHYQVDKFGSIQTYTNERG